MELGEKLRAARLDAAMTQKQLSEGIVTRNMLSQIENGIAKPSMKTLEAFAARLNRNISYFLEESSADSPNTRVMEAARSAFDSGKYFQALSALESYIQPDKVYDRERQLLEQLCLLEAARQAISSGKLPYARKLLESCREYTAYCGKNLRRERLLLLGKLPGSAVSRDLPSLDEELLIRAEEALNRGAHSRAEALLEACEEREDFSWRLLRGKCAMAQGQYAQARKYLLAAEKTCPEEAVPLLEVCFRELGDFQQAYQYACKQRK